MTLYLKYRPQKIDELDLENVRDAIKSIATSKDIPHAFLFSGPKGTGKTSAARILAKIVNCTNLGQDGEPCNKCDSCISITKGNNIDVIEIDAASNRGIDDIRSLKEGIYLAPLAVSKKVYIIDEAHMLTLEAANAFLKTLEEPPEHALFILATTNPERLPATVVSRLTQINFVKAGAKDVARQLKRVAKGEKIKIDDEAIYEIAKFADGSFRDAVKILESLILKSKDIKASDVKDAFFSSGLKLSEFFEHLASRDIKANLEFVEALVKEGTPIKNFIDEVLQNIHRSVLAKNGLGEDELKNFRLEDLVLLSSLFGEARRQNSPVLQLPFEIAIIEYCGGVSDDKPSVAEKPKEVEIRNGRFDEALWQKLLSDIHSKNVSIEALLRGAEPISFDGKNFTLGVYYKFHKDKLEDAKNMEILEDVCERVFRVNGVKISYRLVDRPSRKNSDEQPKPDLTKKVDADIIEAAKEIFG